MTIDLAPLPRRTGLPRSPATAATAAAALVAAVLLASLPAPWAAALRGAADAALAPAQRMLRPLDAPPAGQRPAADPGSLSAVPDGVSAELHRLRQENRRLREALAAGGSAEAPSGLLQASGLPARVLGQQALAFLGRQKLLDRGESAGAQLDAWVTGQQRPHVVDAGSDLAVEPGLAAAGGEALWGRVVSVGPHTSVVRTLCQRGYRELVRLAGPSPAAPASAGPQGILEGVGEPLARIRRVEVTVPVAVGDLVYTAGHDGLLPAPLLCGRIVRVERPVGAAFWELWMEPALPADAPRQVTIVRTGLNPRRDKAP